MKTLTKNEKLIILDALTDYHKMTEQAGETIQNFILESEEWLSQEITSVTEDRLMKIERLRKKFLLNTHEVILKENTLNIQRVCPVCDMDFWPQVGIWPVLKGPKFLMPLEGSICLKCAKKSAPELKAKLQSVEINVPF